MTKTLPKLISGVLLAFFLGSCSSESDCPDCPTCGENLMYGTLFNSELEEDVVPEPTVDTVIVVDEQFEENKVIIEQKFGEQWDFCRCVLANDSLDRVVKSGAEMDDNFMKVFETVDVKCKAFLVMSPNQTPIERAAHEKKVKNCLKNAKR